MNPVSLPRLIGYAIIALLLVGVIGMGVVIMGGTPLEVTPMIMVLELFLALMLIWSGIHVKRYLAHRKTWVNALNALRIAVAARASAYVSSIVTGTLIALMLISMARIGAPAMVANAVISGLSAVAGIIWCVCAVIVERWCVIDADDDPEHHSPNVSPA